jgi:hypothetical protein
MRIVVGLVIVMLLSGCALFKGSDGPVSCDGAEKRLANPGKWDGPLSLGCQESRQ